jgi:hypothetical protein
MYIFEYSVLICMYMYRCVSIRVYICFYVHEAVQKDSCLIVYVYVWYVYIYDYWQTFVSTCTLELSIYIYIYIIGKGWQVSLCIFFIDIWDMVAFFVYVYIFICVYIYMCIYIYIHVYLHIYPRILMTKFQVWRHIHIAVYI